MSVATDSNVVVLDVGARSDLRECDRSARGHAWFEADDPGTWQPDRKYFARLVDKCLRCDTYRFRGCNAYGEVESMWYSYPDDWPDRWGVGNDRPDGAEIRRQQIIEANRRRRRRRAR